MRALVEAGVRVDEEMVVKAYQALQEMEFESEEKMDEGEGLRGGEGDYLGGEKGRRVVEITLGS